MVTWEKLSIGAGVIALIGGALNAWKPRYFLPILLGCLIFFGFFLMPFIVLDSDTRTVIFALGGLLSAIPIKLFWDKYSAPILDMNTIPVPIPDFPSEGFTTFRLKILNKGRSAAKNCKGYIVRRDLDYKERICWTVGSQRPEAIINAHDS